MPATVRPTAGLERVVRGSTPGVLAIARRSTRWIHAPRPAEASREAVRIRAACACCLAALIAQARCAAVRRQRCRRRRATARGACARARGRPACKDVREREVEAFRLLMLARAHALVIVGHASREAGLCARAGRIRRARHELAAAVLVSALSAGDVLRQGWATSTRDLPLFDPGDLPASHARGKDDKQDEGEAEEYRSSARPMTARHLFFRVAHFFRLPASHSPSSRDYPPRRLKQR
jgi:hypothetical protein